MREAKSETGRGGGRGGGGGGGGRGYGRGRGRGGGGFNRETAVENSFSNSGVSSVQGATEELDTGRNPDRRGGYGGPRVLSAVVAVVVPVMEEAGDGERPRRAFERHSGTGRG